MSIQLVLSVLLGAVAGFAFYRFVGCRSGTCAIWANPIASSVYGALIGALVGGGM